MWHTDTSSLSIHHQLRRGAQPAHGPPGLCEGTARSRAGLLQGDPPSPRSMPQHQERWQSRCEEPTDILGCWGLLQQAALAHLQGVDVCSMLLLLTLKPNESCGQGSFIRSPITGC